MITPAKINKIFTAFSRHNPAPQTELIFGNDFQLLLSVLLSAQAQDKTVNKATIELFKILKRPSDIYNISEAQLIDFIKSIGLFRTKAKNIIKTSKILAERYQDKLPGSRELLSKLPGIGQKSSAVLANALFKQPTIAVDTHVFRVSNRLGLVNTKNIEKTEQQLYEVLPEWAKPNAHHWLVLHGRYICTAKRPKCDDCFINKYCYTYLNKKLPSG